MRFLGNCLNRVMDGHGEEEEKCSVFFSFGLGIRILGFKEMYRGTRVNKSSKKWGPRDEDEDRNFS